MLLIENPQNKIVLSAAEKSSSKHILWELESACNMKCRYCYESRTKGVHLSRERVDQLVELLSKSDIETIHITGGEPTISPYFQQILKALSHKKLCITTNLFSFPKWLKQAFLMPGVASVAVSLDSFSPEINDSLRGNTREVVAHLSELLDLRRKTDASVRIRIHTVISQKNLSDIPNLLRRAKEMGIDEVSCQPISLSEDHPLSDSLSLSIKDQSAVRQIYDLEKELFAGEYADSHQLLTDYYLAHPEMYTNDGAGFCDPYIDAAGRVWNCPLKRRPFDLLNGQISREIGTCRITPQCMCCLKRYTYTVFDRKEGIK